MNGQDILVRTLTKSERTDVFGNTWQYMSRSDHHSKVACWGLMFDLIKTCSLIRRHIEAGRIGFGVNHEMRDFVQARKKNLDLVLCTPASGSAKRFSDRFSTFAAEWSVQLTPNETTALLEMPTLPRVPVGSVLMALEAKACMTAHQKALPRLYDELNSSHLTIHGATDQAIAAAFVMVNAAETYLSPDRNKANRKENPTWSRHVQPRAAQLVVDKVRQLPRRSRPGEVGYDALAITVIDCRNDSAPVSLVDSTPAPKVGDIDHYCSFVDRLGHIYSTRFRDL